MVGNTKIDNKVHISDNSKGKRSIFGFINILQFLADKKMKQPNNGSIKSNNDNEQVQQPNNAFIKLYFDKNEISCVADIPKLFKESALAIQNSWKKKKKGETKVMVDNTRFSTFVTLTDGNRVLLFNREVESHVNYTEIYNPRYDVFGSIYFENNSLSHKLGHNSEFLNARINDIENIDGIAIEESPKKETEHGKVVVAIGLCIYLSSEDLEKAINKSTKDRLQIFSLARMQELHLTSKAALACSHLMSKKTQKTKS